MSHTSLGLSHLIHQSFLLFGVALGRVTLQIYATFEMLELF